MNSPLKIMDEIVNGRGGSILFIPRDVHRLRWALEAQAEELAKVREWNRQMVEKAASGGTLEGYREMGRKLAQAEARIARLEGELQYFIDKVESGRARSRKTYARYKEALNESPAQSAAHLKAELVEALRESQKDLVAVRNSTRKAAKTDSDWEGVPEILEERVRANNAILAKHES